MSKLDLRRLEERQRRYADPRCQIAHFVLAEPTATDEDRRCAAAILGALDGVSHAEYLTVVPVDRWTLSSSAFQDAERLWEKYADCATRA